MTAYNAVLSSPPFLSLFPCDCLLRHPTPIHTGLSTHHDEKVHTAATILDKTNLIKYDRSGKTFQPTALGRVASYFYVTHQTMARYNEYLKPTMSDIEIFR